MAVKRHYHIPELQSVRGIAALVVLLSHASFLFVTSDRFHYWSEVLLNAHAAVMLFFVLSGYVLSRSLSGGELDGRRAFDFYVNRLFRIYPALWAACGLALLYVFLIHFQVPTLHESRWYDAYFLRLPSSANILRNIFIANGPAALVPPSWSIFVELLGSAAIPVFVLANRKGTGLAILGVTVAIALLVVKTGHLGSLMYLPSFSMGALAFRYQDRLKPIFANPAMLAACLGMVLFFRRVNPAWRFDTNYDAFPPVLIESVFAAGVVLSLAARPVQILRVAPLIWLGDVSYSLYLFHFIVMSALAKILGTTNLPPDLRAAALMVTTLAVTLPLAALSYEWIEKAGITAGKKSVGAMKAT